MPSIHILNLLLHVLHDVTGLHLELDRSAGKRLHQNLHNAAQTRDEVQHRLHLHIIFYQDSRILNPASTPHNLQGSHCALYVHLLPNCKANPMA